MADLGGTGSAGLKPGIVMSCVFATCEYNAVHGKKGDNPSLRGRVCQLEPKRSSHIGNRSRHRRRAADRLGEEARGWLVLVARCRQVAERAGKKYQAAHLSVCHAQPKFIDIGCPLLAARGGERGDCGT